jgi:hypothetical protein
MTWHNSKWPTHHTFGVVALLGGSLWIAVGAAVAMTIRLLLQ